MSHSWLTLSQCVGLRAGITDLTHSACMGRRGTPHTHPRSPRPCLDRRAGSPRGLFPPSGWTGSRHACRGRSPKNLPTAALKLCNTYTPFTRPGLPALSPVLLSAVLSDVIIFSAHHNSVSSRISEVSTRLQQLISTDYKYI